MEDNPEDYRNESKFGAIPGVEVGATWRTRQVFVGFDLVAGKLAYDATREACAKARVHTSIKAGISGGKNGAYSIVMSGGYQDDEDKGDEMWVTDHRSLPLRSHQSTEYTLARVDTRTNGMAEGVATHGGAARKSRTSPSSTTTTMRYA